MAPFAGKLQSGSSCTRPNGYEGMVDVQCGPNCKGCSFARVELVGWGVEERRCLDDNILLGP